MAHNKIRKSWINIDALVWIVFALIDRLILSYIFEDDQIKQDLEDFITPYKTVETVI